MRRIPELDAVRGLAAIVIVLYHVAPGVAPFGWLAVDFFLILSGYLITTILLKNQNDRRLLYNFYARRSLRIWPIYYLTVLGMAGLVFLLRRYLPRDYSFEALPQYLVYMQHIEAYWGGREPKLFPGLSHTWTLALEEQFYLIWPILVCLAGRRWVIPLASLYLVISVLFRSLGYPAVLLLSRGDGFALGSMLAAFLLDRESVVRDAAVWTRRMGIVAAGALAWITVPYLLPTEFLVRMGALSLWAKDVALILPMCVLFFAVVGLLVVHNGRRLLAPLRGRALVGTGVISYGIYLYHVPVIMLVELVFRKFGIVHTLGPDRPLYRGAIEIVVTVVLALLSWRFVERPILGLKERFQYHPARTVPDRDSTAVAESEGATVTAGASV
jgi:peptidoglycan/LPS O-acetylase OafA/YrhL